MWCTEQLTALTFGCVILYVQVQKKLVIACILCFIFMIIEVIGGYIAKRWVTVQPLNALIWAERQLSTFIQALSVSGAAVLVLHAHLSD
jgi:hypothetical protein